MHKNLYHLLLVTSVFGYSLSNLQADLQSDEAAEQRRLDYQRQEQKIQENKREERQLEDKREEQEIINRKLEQRRLDEAREERKRNERFLVADLHEAEMEFRNYNYYNEDPSIPENGVNNHPPFSNSPYQNTQNPYQEQYPYSQQSVPQYQNPLYPRADDHRLNSNQDSKNIYLKIEELQRENQQLKQQNDAIQAQQKHQQETHKRRQQIEAQWEQDHERE